MNHLNILFFIFTLFALGCQSKPSEKTGSQITEAPMPTFQHFRLHDSKTESSGSNKNTMELCYITDKYDIDELRNICFFKKENFRDGNFLFIVIFDKKQNASFPSTPFTSAFGTDDDIMKHIKALYTFNSTNGYSVLATYDKNMLQSVVKEVKI